MIYCFICPTCKAKKEVTLSVSERNTPQLCDNDAFVMNRDYEAEFCGTKVIGEIWPLVSAAAGVGASQVEQATRHSYEIGVPTHFNSEGDAIFTSRSHRKKYLSAIGMFDRSACFGDPTPKYRTR